MKKQLKLLIGSILIISFWTLFFTVVFDMGSKAILGIFFMSLGSIYLSLNHYGFGVIQWFFNEQKA